MKTNKQKFEVEVDVPEGYEVIAIREPRSGESYLGLSTGEVLVAGRGYIPSNLRVIVQPVVKYREPRMPDDYGKEIEVRDLSNSDSEWLPTTLCGIREGKAYKYLSLACEWKYARILEE